MSFVLGVKSVQELPLKDLVYRGRKLARDGAKVADGSADGANEDEDEEGEGEGTMKKVWV